MTQPRGFKSRLSALVVAVLSIVALAHAAPPASAANASCGNYHHWFAGVTAPPFGQQYSDGADARLSVQSQPLCSTNTAAPRTSSAWVMIAGDGWAQIGYWHNSDLCCRRYFWQWTVCPDASCNTYTASWGSPSNGDVNEFSVIWNTSDHHLHMYIGGSTPTCMGQPPYQCPETDFNPRQAWTLDDAEFYGEVDFPGSDIAGSSSFKTSFTSVEEDPQGSDGWGSYTWIVNLDCDVFYHQSDISQYSSFKIWTYPPDHDAVCENQP